jgi:hypothetical protein
MVSSLKEHARHSSADAPGAARDNDVLGRCLKCHLDSGVEEDCRLVERVGLGEYIYCYDKTWM